MENLELLVKAWDMAHWELGEAFKGLPDDAVWVRPHPNLLSIGEIAAHLAYWEGTSVAGPGCTSPLMDAGARYYTSNVAAPVSLGIRASEVYDELERIHAAAKETMLAMPHESEDSNPNRDGWTWGQTVEYMVFHVGYHTGQIYSIRHLMGHETIDN